MSDHTSQTSDRHTVLHVHLQDGFADDVVVVRVQGTDILSAEAVSSSLLTGLAAETQVPVEAGRVVVKVSIPRRRLEAEHVMTVAAGEERWLGVDVDDGRISFIDSDRPFFYG